MIRRKQEEPKNSKRELNERHHGITGKRSVEIRRAGCSYRKCDRSHGKPRSSTSTWAREGGGRDREVPVLVGTDLQFPGPCSCIYETSMTSSSGVHGPFLIPTLSQQGGLPITLCRSLPRSLWDSWIVTTATIEVSVYKQRSSTKGSPLFHHKTTTLTFFAFYSAFS